MPLVIGQLLRILLQAFVTAGFTTSIQNILDGTLRSLVRELMDTEDLTEEEAKDYFFDIVSDLLVNTGIITSLLTFRVPVRISEYLGLTSKNYGRKTLSVKASKAAAKLSKTGGKSLVSGSLSKAFKILAIPASLIWLTNAVANIIEPGIYKPAQTNAVYKKLGIPFQYPSSPESLEPGGFSNKEFRELFNQLKISGVRGINNTFIQQTQLFTEQLFADLIDRVYGNAIISGKKMDKSLLKKALLPFLIIPDSSKPAVSGIISQATKEEKPISDTQVFTGVLIGGRLGERVEFTPRRDDLIENLSELRQAIANNESPWLASLPGRIVREISTPSSVVIDGITKRAEAVKVQIGTKANGSPIFRTVVNKFAVADIYYVQDSNSRIKLDRIIYGPIDALNFKPTPQELNELANQISKSIFTQDTNKVSAVVSATPTEDIRREEVSEIENETGVETRLIMGKIAPASLSIPAPVAVPTFVDVIRSGRPSERVKLQEVRDYLNRGQTLGETIGLIKTAISLDGGRFLDPVTVEWFNSLTPVDIDTINMLESSKAGKDMQSTGTAQTAQNGGIATTSQTSPERATLSATTLFEYYSSIGKPLPTLTERAALYQSLGLGQAAFYTGTGEQNTKLLNALVSGATPTP